MRYKSGSGSGSFSEAGSVSLKFLVQPNSDESGTELTMQRTKQAGLRYYARRYIFKKFVSREISLVYKFSIHQNTFWIPFNIFLVDARNEV